MLQRRRFMVMTAASLLTGIQWLARPASAQGATDRASTFIKSIGDQLVAVVNGPGSDRDKRARLTAIIDNGVDVDGVARFCLGRFWRTASPDQQHRYMELFHQVLVNNITAKIGDYRGVRFQMGRSQQRNEEAVVSTVVERPSNPPTNVDWIVSNPSSDPKVIDVVAEGTSLRLTQRQDYASYLTHNNNNIDALINAMRQQVAEAS